MKQKKIIYGVPNTGCLLGVAYQRECSRLEISLKAEGLEITSPEYLVMRVIFNQEGLQLCEIGEILGKDKGAVSRCVSSLVRKGLVRTESISHKCLRTYLSAKGEGLRSLIMKVSSIREAELKSTLTDKEIEQLDTTLLKIINK